MILFDFFFFCCISKDAQLIGLEKRFETQKYLSTPDRIELADMLHLSQLQVKTWYVENIPHEH